ncbi:MAG: hypothetical protein PHU21_11870 [Elusimicrobia bacterium]|nr:hypothetical protein [Elusimicrobiota bacterium]
MLTVIFVAAGLVFLGLGWWLFHKFRDDRPEDQKSFRHFDLGPRGLLAVGGILLMLSGGASILVGIFFRVIGR